MYDKRNMSSYAFSILKYHGDNSNKINFKNLNKGFYDEISSDDKTIKINKTLLNKIKKITIKDLLKSNKKVPVSWRNNYSSENDIINIYNKNNKKFLSLSPPKNCGKLPKINLIKHRNTNNNDLKEESKSENIKSFFQLKKLKTYKIKTRKELENDNIKILLDNYRALYPIEELKLEHKTEHGIGDKNKIKNLFRHNIYGLVSPRKNKINLSLFNNNDSRNNSRIIEERNRTIEQNLKSIDYYGPHYSFCPSCRSKNMEFYKDMEFNQCLKLINYIKNFRNNNNTHFGLKFPSSVASSDSND